MNLPGLTDVLKAFAREELAVYATVQWPAFEVPRHVEIICDALQDVEAGRCKRLIISEPPRHGKSLTCSEIFPAWYLGKHPDHYFISTAYGEDLAIDFGRKVRNYLNSPQHQEVFPDCKLASDSASAHRFTIEGRGGTYYAVGRGGPITGRGAHVLLIDDPIKDDLEASSEIVRAQLHGWYQSVARTRLMPGGAVIIVTTRWHVDDLPGWVLEHYASEGWRVISMPALSEGAGDVMGRPEGIALWPEKYDEAALIQTREGMEARLWDALYQQRPSIGGGYMFDTQWMEYYDIVGTGRGMNKYILVDPANSKRKQSDMTAMWVVGLNGDESYYILDMVHDRLAVHDRVDELFRLHRKYRPLGVGYEETGLQTDIEHAQRRMKDDNYNFTITALNSTVPKRNRIEALQPLFRQRKFRFPHSFDVVTRDGMRHDLVKDFILQEFSKYPAVKHDDRLDALQWIASPVPAKRGLQFVWPELDEYENSLGLNEERERYTKRPRRRGSAWAM